MKIKNKKILIFVLLVIITFIDSYFYSIKQYNDEINKKNILAKTLIEQQLKDDINDKKINNYKIDTIKYEKITSDGYSVLISYYIQKYPNENFINKKQSIKINEIEKKINKNVIEIQ